MMASRKARRSSILKTRDPDETNLDDGVSRNFTGLLQRRRVSFNHTNQVKEFEKSNSSHEGSMSKTKDHCQTMCAEDLDMSISVLANCEEIKGEKTTLEPVDMSVYEEQFYVNQVENPRYERRDPDETNLDDGASRNFTGLLQRRRVSFNHTNQVKEFEKSNSFHEGSMSKTKDHCQTMYAEDLDMSISVLANSEEIKGDKTRLEPVDMSVYGEQFHVNQVENPRCEPSDPDETNLDDGVSRNFAGFLQRSRVSFNHTNHVKEVEKSNSFHEGSLSKTKDHCQTVCPEDLDMSISVLANCEEIKEDKTRLEAVDMSVYGEQFHVSQVENPLVLNKPTTTQQLYFNEPDPQQFRNPFCQKKPRMKPRTENQKELAKISFGKFGSAKTPKRNKLTTNIVPPKTLQVKNVNEVVVQTSPMVQAPIMKKSTREIGLNCTITNHGTPKEYLNVSMMTSPMVFSPSQSQRMENVEKNDISMMTSPMVFPPSQSQRMENVEKNDISMMTSLMVFPPSQNQRMENVDKNNISMMTSPIVFPPSQSQRMENVEKNNISMMTSPTGSLPCQRVHNVSMMTLPKSFSQSQQIEYVDMSFEKLAVESDEEENKVTETLRSCTVLNSPNSRSSQIADENSFRRISEKSHDVLVQVSFSASPTVDNHQTPQGTEVAATILERSLTPPNPFSTRFLDLKYKLTAYSDATVDLFEKWGFLSNAMEDLCKITEYEWNEILKSGKIREFLGEIYIKAVNLNRSTLNDPHPLYRGAIQRLAELEKKDSKEKCVSRI